MMLPSPTWTSAASRTLRSSVARGPIRQRSPTKTAGPMMAQVGGMLVLGTEDISDKVVYFMSLDNVKFRRPVLPGDQLRCEVEMVQFRGKTCKMKGVAFVDGQVVAEAEMMARVVDR